jgi:ribosomal 50S subunit-recycling heat shock protein
MGLKATKRMRLDKFLKVSRLIKRRTVANDLSTGGGVQINGKVAKPAADVRVGDVLTLELGARVLSVRVEQVPEKAVPAQLAGSLYTVLSDTYNKASSSEL